MNLRFPFPHLTGPSIHPDRLEVLKMPPEHLPTDSKIRLSPRDFCRLHGTHLLRPSDAGLNFLHGSELIGGVAGDADVVVTFEDQLQIADFELLGAAKLGETAGCNGDVVDEFVGYVE